MPFIFYITNEQLLILVDELTRHSLSSMLDSLHTLNHARAKLFLTTAKEEHKEDVVVVTTYRLPYMTMPKA